MPVIQKNLDLFQHLSWQEVRHITLLDAIASALYYAKQALGRSDNDSAWAAWGVADELSGLLGVKFCMKAASPLKVVPEPDLFVPISNSNNPRRRMVYEAALATARWKLERLV